MGADEGRDKTAKRRGELSSELSRGFPNGATRPGAQARSRQAEHIGLREGTGGTETSQYPEERTVLP